MFKDLNKSLDLEISQKYTLGISAPALAREYEVSNKAVYKILSRTKTKTRSFKEAHPVLVDHNYFKELNETKAYYLGLLITDGQVQDLKQNSKILRLDLQEQDEDIIFQFAKDIKFQGKVALYRRPAPNQNVRRITIKSDSICEDLQKYNIMPRKTFTTYWPEKLPRELVKDFIRGCIDGDGYISDVTPKEGKQTTYRISITGTEALLKGIQEQVHLYLPDIKLGKFYTRHPKRNNNIRTLSFDGKKNCQEISEWLYQNADRYIKRKHLRASKMFQSSLR